MSDQKRMLNSRQKNYTDFCDAFVKKDRRKIKDLINDNVPVNCPNSRENTPLHWTIIQFNDIDIMTMLLDKGADIYARNQNDETPLDLAVQNDRTEAAALLIKKGALDNEDLNSLLLAAIDRNHVSMVKLLIDYEKNCDPSINLMMPLQRYIPKNFVMKSSLKTKECFDLLLNNNFTIHPDCYHDVDFIYKAIENGHSLIVSQLLEHGIDVNMINSKTGFNLLTIACLKKRYKVIEKLLELNADVNMSIPDEKLKNVMTFSINLNVYRQLLKSYDQESDLIDITCLHVAVFNSDTAMTKLLLKFGAKITYDPTYSTLIRIAVYNRCEEIVLAFLEHGVSLDSLDPKGNSLVHFCIYYDPSRKDHNYNIIKLLIERGANIQTPGNDLVFGALINEHHRILQLLLDYNVDVQYCSPDGDSLIHIVIKKEYHIALVERLLTLNAPTNVTDNEGMTPLAFLCKSIPLPDIIKMIKLLLQYGADVNCADNCLKTPLHYACQHQNVTNGEFIFISPYIIKVIELLLENDANVNCVDNCSMTPLLYACVQLETFVKSNEEGFFRDNIITIAKIIKLLLKHEANIEVVDNRGWTPILIAANFNLDAVFKCFLDHHIKSHAKINQGKLPVYIEWQCQRNSIDDSSLPNNISQCMTLLLQLIKNLPSTYIDLNSVDRNGNTLLHCAVADANDMIVQELIKYGADVNVYDRTNLTPFDISCSEQAKKSDNIINMLAIHVIKLEAAGLYVNLENFILVADKFYLLKVNIMEELKEEIKMMKSETISIKNGNVTRNITFYNLLKKSIPFLSRFVNIENVQEILKSKRYDFIFPFYINIIRNRFREAKIRHALENAAREYFGVHIKHTLPDECIDMILSELSMEDLKTIIIALKPSDTRQSSLLIQVISDTREMLIFHY